MKKILFVTLALLVSSGVFAQKFRFGFKGTTGYSGFKALTKSVEDNGGKLAYGYGIMLDWNLGTHYAFSTGIDMAYKGGSLKYLIDSVAGTSKINLQYVQIPIGLKMKTGEIGYMTYFLNVGTSVGIRVSTNGDYNLKDGAITFVNAKDSSLRDYINPVALSLLISGGVEYNITGNTSLVLSLLFDNSFLDVLKNDIKSNATGETITRDMGARVNVIGLSLGIFF